jgi:uroporphyrinogen decarboxylase
LKEEAFLRLVWAVKLRILETFDGAIEGPPPIWLMRQAGRYLDEYRAIRKETPDFIAFCFDVERAVEVTLQPIRRFGFDAAIIFSDILVVPLALGQKVWFVEGEGPRLEPITDPSELSRLAAKIDLARLEPVYRAVREVRRALPPQTGLIGFCGAPFTLATYMIAGRGTRDQAPARLFAYRYREAFERLIDLLTQSCIAHLLEQVREGARIVQIFDSWAGVLPIEAFRSWSERPIVRITQAIHAAAPGTRVIAFPRGTQADPVAFMKTTGADALALDTAADLAVVRKRLPPKVVTQGNLDPLVLVAGGDALDRAVDGIIEATDGAAHLFNLGHGILPETPIAHVERLVARVRGS